MMPATAAMNNTELTTTNSTQTSPCNINSTSTSQRIPCPSCLPESLVQCTPEVTRFKHTIFKSSPHIHALFLNNLFSSTHHVRLGLPNNFFLSYYANGIFYGFLISQSWKFVKPSVTSYFLYPVAIAVHVTGYNFETLRSMRMSNIYRSEGQMLNILTAEYGWKTLN
jgi:hypothetical protein